MTKFASGDLGIKSEQFSHTFADKVRIVYFTLMTSGSGEGEFFHFIPSFLKKKKLLPKNCLGRYHYTKDFFLPRKWLKILLDPPLQLLRISNSFQSLYIFFEWLREPYNLL